MKVINPFKEAADAVIEAGGEALKLCYQCGLCTGVCPWNLVRNFLAQKLIHQAQLGLVDIESEEIWLCATCGACVARCPRNVEIIDIFRALRRIGTEWGASPKTLRTALTAMGTVGNPWGEAREKRGDWAKGLEIEKFSQGCEILLFPCCTPAYDPRAKGMATALAEILKKAGVDFGILGDKEVCCGESARKAGDESLFQSLARSNITTFAENNVSNIVAISPHCYHSFKNEYPELGGNFTVLHYTQYLRELIAGGRIKPTKELNKRVAYHDSCYLGRHNEVYDEPREILRHIPGLELIELPDSRADSLCCSGGGGRMWLETRKEERLSNLRLEQALEVGAEILAISCPYCLLNLDDSRMVLGKEEMIEIKDISELLLAVI